MSNNAARFPVPTVNGSLQAVPSTRTGPGDTARARSWPRRRASSVVRVFVPNSGKGTRKPRSSMLLMCLPGKSTQLRKRAVNGLNLSIDRCHLLFAERPGLICGVGILQRLGEQVHLKFGGRFA